MLSQPNTVSHVNADLTVCPNRLHTADKSDQLTIGDLHGNALKLIYFLIACHALVLSPVDYDAIRDIYNKNVDELSAGDLKRFNKIVSRFKFNPVGTIRLIGDDLADRGSNDYFTLKIMQQLRIQNVSVEILISNHGIEFVETIEKQDEKLQGARMLDDPPHYMHASSMYALQTLIDKKLVKRSEVDALYHDYYKYFLRALSYTYDSETDHLTIYSHAPVDKTLILAMADKLKINITLEEVEGDNEKLAHLIDQINIKFHEHVKNNTVYTLYSDDVMKLHYDAASVVGSMTSEMFRAFKEKSYNPVECPFEYLMWNRDVAKLKRVDETITWVHGHDLAAPTDANKINLDANNSLGKRLGENQNETTGNLDILYSQQTPAVTLMLGSVAEAWQQYEDAKKKLNTLTLVSDEKYPYDPSLVQHGKDVYAKVDQAVLWMRVHEKLDKKMITVDEINTLTELLQRTTKGIEKPLDEENIKGYQRLTEKMSAEPVLGKRSWPKILVGAGVAFLGVLMLAASIALFACGWTAVFGVFGIKLSTTVLLHGISAIGIGVAPVVIGAGASYGHHGRQKGVASASLGFFGRMNKIKKDEDVKQAIPGMAQ